MHLVFKILAFSVCASVFAAEPKAVVAEYTARLATASEELNATRVRIGNERSPLSEKVKASENRLLSAETQLLRAKTAKSDAGERRKRLLREAEGLQRNLSYLNSLSTDSARALRDGAAPGRIDEIEAALAFMKAGANARGLGQETTQFVKTAGVLLDEIRADMGGRTRDGTAVFEGSQDIVEGTFAYVGPETFFRSKHDGRAGIARNREGSPLPVALPVSTWQAADSDRLFQHTESLAPLDASGGKAIRVGLTRGTVWSHIEKGGKVAYVILATGLLALYMIIRKMIDLARAGVDAPPQVQAWLERAATAGTPEARASAAQLRPMTRALFETGLSKRGGSKEALEEFLEAKLLEQRLFLERGLPILVVIATAAPLLGLLGTVTGMVKTFALITVFGTGNAGRLSGGISEVLVATEMGLAVAIPTLIAHGFLSNRAQKIIALLERYAVEFVATNKSSAPATTSPALVEKNPA